MKTPVDYIDAMKERHNLPSDYAAAKFLGVTPSAISKYRLSKSFPDEITSAKIAASLHLQPIEVIAASQYARTTDVNARALWLQIWTDAGGAYRAGLENVAGWLVGSPDPAHQGNGLW